MVIYKDIITREEIRRNPSFTYLFGDNLMGVGMGGQAYSMRGEFNAIGIPTKKKPDITEDSYFTDKEYEQNVKHIDKAFSKIPDGGRGIVVIPKAGLGTGLAGLPMRAPKTFEYLQKKIKELEKV